MAELKRIEVGFIGNQVITLKLEEGQLKDLRKNLSGGGWRTIVTEDGEVEIDLAKVAFVRVAGSGHGVGFSS
jgi:hypothetical protein